jgi:TadE-like protein
MSRVRRDDAASATVELAALLPVFILFFGLVTWWGRTADAQATADAAARWAARTISLARGPTEALAQAEADASTTVGEGRAACQTMGFEPAVTATEVTVTVTCTVDVSELLLLPVPGSSTITATATEPLDQYQERGQP